MDLILLLFTLKPDKYLMINQKSRFIEAQDGVQSTIAKWTKSSIAKLSTEETLINRAIFNFGSPLNGAEDIVNKGIVFLDHVPHYWMVKIRDLLIEYFISIKTFLLVKTIFKNRRALYVIREVVKYENFQAFLFRLI